MRYLVLLLFLLLSPFLQSSVMAQKAAGSTEYSRLQAGYKASIPAWINRFETDIRKFELEDSTLGHPHYDVVFTGSSTFALWESLPEDFAPIKAINRGFGGSTIREVIHYAPRIIYPYKPRIVVLYVANDIWGKPDDPTPAQLFNYFRYFEQTLHRQLPNTILDIVGMRPTPIKAKLNLLKKEAAVNQKLKAYAATRRNTHYIDFDPIAYDTAGNLRMDLAMADSLQMNAIGNQTFLGKLKPLIQKQLQKPMKSKKMKIK